MRPKQMFGFLATLALVLGGGTASLATPIYSIDIGTLQTPSVTLISANNTSGNARLQFQYNQSPHYYLYRQYVQGAEAANYLQFSPSCNADFRVTSVSQIDVIARGKGSCTFTVKFLFDLNADAISSAERFRQFGNTVTGPSIEIPIRLEFSEAGQLDIRSSTSYTANLALTCDSLASSAKLNCSAAPTALDRSSGLKLGGSLSVWVCTYKQDVGNRDCRTQIAGSSSVSAVEVKEFEFPLGKTTFFSMDNFLYTSGSYLTLEVYGSQGYLDSKTWVRTPTEPTYKKLTITFKTPKEVVWGKSYKYSISAAPKLSGTCALWRYQDGSPYKVASPKLTKGSASGSLTWLWSALKSSKTPMSLVAVCTAGSYKGQAGTLVNGYKP